MKKRSFKKIAIWSFFFIVIFGILAAIAIPSSCDYMPRSRIIDGLALAAGAKITVAENAENGLPFADGWIAPKATKNVSSVKINPANGIITITYTDEVADNSPTLLLIPEDSGRGMLQVGKPSESDSIAWHCHADTVPKNSPFPHLLGTVPSKMVPANCRG